MTLAPLANAPLPIQLHVAFAVSAFFLGAALLFKKKGDRVHKLMGRVWAILMLGTALSSFWINELRTFGPFSAIHLLSLLTIVTVVTAVWAIRRRNVALHRRMVAITYAGAMILAGAFTLVPGRRMHDVLFGADAGVLPALVIVPVAFIAAGILLRRMMVVPSVRRRRPTSRMAAHTA